MSENITVTYARGSRIEVKPVYQWNANIGLAFSGAPSGSTCAFWTTNAANSLSVSLVDGAFSVPNSLLTGYERIHALLCLNDGTATIGVMEVVIPVTKRPKPTDYVKSDDENVIKASNVLANCQAVYEQFKNDGNFYAYHGTIDCTDDSNIPDLDDYKSEGTWTYISNSSHEPPKNSPYGNTVSWVLEVHGSGGSGGTSAVQRITKFKSDNDKQSYYDRSRNSGGWTDWRYHDDSQAFRRNVWQKRIQRGSKFQLIPVDRGVATVSDCRLNIVGSAEASFGGTVTMAGAVKAGGNLLLCPSVPKVGTDNHEDQGPRNNALVTDADGNVKKVCRVYAKPLCYKYTSADGTGMYRYEGVEATDLPSYWKVLQGKYGTSSVPDNATTDADGYYIIPSSGTSNYIGRRFYLTLACDTDLAAGDVLRIQQMPFSASSVSAANPFIPGDTFESIADKAAEIMADTTGSLALTDYSNDIDERLYLLSGTELGGTEVAAKSKTSDWDGCYSSAKSDCSGTIWCAYAKAAEQVSCEAEATGGPTVPSGYLPSSPSYKTKAKAVDVYRSWRMCTSAASIGYGMSIVRTFLPGEPDSATTISKIGKPGDIYMMMDTYETVGSFGHVAMYLGKRTCAMQTGVADDGRPVIETVEDYCVAETVNQEAETSTGEIQGPHQVIRLGYYVANDTHSSNRRIRILVRPWADPDIL